MNSFYSNCYDGSQPIETAIMEDLITFIDNNYSTLGDAGRVIMGFSMGVSGTLKTLAKFDDKFLCGVSLDGALLTYIQHINYGTTHPSDDYPLYWWNNIEANYLPYSLWDRVDDNATVLDGRTRKSSANPFLLKDLLVCGS